MRIRIKREAIGTGAPPIQVTWGGEADLDNWTQGHQLRIVGTCTLEETDVPSPGCPSTRGVTLIPDADAHVVMDGRVLQ